MSDIQDPNSSIWKQLLHLGEQLLAFQNPEEQKAIIIQASQDILKCDVQLWLQDLDGEDGLANGKLSPIMKNALQNLHLVGPVTETDQAYPPARKRPKKRKILPAVEPGEVHVMAVPLLAQSQPLGVLQVSRTMGPEFTQDEIELLDGLAVQSSIALQASRRINQDRRQAELLSLVQKVSAQIADVLDIDELAKRVTRLIIDTFRYYYVAIFTVEPGGNPHLTYRHGIREDQSSQSPDGWQENPLLSISVKLGEGIIGYVAQTGDEVIANDVSKDPHYRAIDVLPETKSEAALALIVDDRILGVMDVQSNQLNTFQNTDILVLRALADHIATAVENARLYGTVQQRADQLALVAGIGNAITSILDLDELLKRVVSLVYDQLGYPYVNIYSVHPGRRLIFLQASQSKIETSPLEETVTLNLDDTTGIVPFVARSSQTVLVDNVPHHELFRAADPHIQNVKSILAVALTFTGHVLGVLEVQSDEQNAFSPEDQSLLEAIADYIAIAMRNASLYRSELWRRQAAESMREVAGLLTADAALDQVLDLILSELETMLPCDIAAIWLTNQKEQEINLNAIHLAAVHLTQDYHQTFDSSSDNHLTDQDILHLLGETTYPSPWLQEALFSLESTIRLPGSVYEPLGAILDFPPDYSAIAAPLRAGKTVLGLLALVHHTNARYGHEAQNLTETFASYAAVAIENTRLYEAAHDQAWVSTVLLQVAEATQSLNTLDELLTTMVRITPMLIGVDSCSIFLWDNTLDSFQPTATYGLSPDEEQEFFKWRIGLGENPAFDQILFAKQPVFVEKQFSGGLFTDSGGSQKSQVLFPMIVHGEVLGALLVNYSLASTGVGNGTLSSEVDWDEKFAIIQGISHQTAIAVENIKLMKSQQDETYVSVALLQVAQAVVSLNALDEILEAIVRITPILVGVKRSGIFIWEPTRKVFRLMQAYGFSRESALSIGDEYSPEDFPLLEAVRTSNSIVYHRITPNTDTPDSWLSLDRQSFGMFDTDVSMGFGSERSDSQEGSLFSREYLKSPDSLLLGFPLSVKGIVLGVMLTQEMDPTVSVPSRHIREKRLEISLGITQQAAMAIQNDLLQSEVVERERLEKEIQLAREIQRTFLPETLPYEPGWELETLWRPARQVSGDFYDIIQLPKNRWGLVIADVADKGMPAALYMTLIRTLIRAAVNEDRLSPAEVLRRVNDLLVADSKSGMFVTIVYGIVDLCTGEFIYANAGHNHPILCRSSQKELEKLGGTAMALGIFEGIEVKQKEIQIEHGDCLVLYTDGITEAFSPQGVMFGEARLLDTILAAEEASAAHLVKTIDQTILDFSEEGPPSDDITLLVLQRCRSDELPPDQ